MSCKSKYKAVAESIPSLVAKSNCLLEASRLVWEENPPRGNVRTNVGCLNDFCCDSIKYFVISKFDYLVYLSFLTAIVGLVNYTTLISFITFLSLYTIKRIEHDKYEKFIGFLMLLGAGTSILYVLVSLP